MQEKDAGDCETTFLAQYETELYHAFLINTRFICLNLFRVVDLTLLRNFKVQIDGIGTACSIVTFGSPPTES